MTYVIDRPNIQLDAADCLAIKNSLESVALGYPCAGPNILLNKADLLALDTSVDGSQGAVQTANLNLTAADVAAMVSHIT